jgi:DNA-directed RNA polymerase subunit RPC12/RpoP
MKCPYCGSETSIPPEARTPIYEHAIAELDYLPQVAPGYYAPGVKGFACSQCGATAQVPIEQTALDCPFCGADVVIAKGPSRALIKPESLVPFGYDKPIALQKFTRWVSKGFFRPGSLKREAAVNTFRGVYVPYFTYDAAAHSFWSGERGDYVGSGKHRHIRWRWRSGFHDAFYDDTLVCASRGLTGPLLKKVEPFNTAFLVPFNEAMLAGYEAEEHSIDPRSGWTTGSQMMLQEERNACSALLGGDVQRNLNVQTQLFNTTFKHVLLPVYIGSYQYARKPWPFFLNGQTGEVVGEAPISWLRVAAVVIVVFGVLALLAAIAQ